MTGRTALRAEMSRGSGLQRGRLEYVSPKNRTSIVVVWRDPKHFFLRRNPARRFLVAT